MKIQKEDSVKCYNCGKVIELETDANILLHWFHLKTYCNNCYSSLEKGLGRYFMGYSEYPINGVMYKICTWFLTACFILGVLLIPFYPLLYFVSNETKIGAIIFLPFGAALVYLMWKVHFNAQKIIKKINMGPKK
jgi:hypothetical protein